MDVCMAAFESSKGQVSVKCIRRLSGWNIVRMEYRFISNGISDGISDGILSGWNIDCQDEIYTTMEYILLSRAPSLSNVVR